MVAAAVTTAATVPTVAAMATVAAVPTVAAMASAATIPAIAAVAATATATTVATTTTTTTTTTILGIGTRFMGNGIWYQNGGSRKDATDCQRQQTFLEKQVSVHRAFSW